VSWWEWIPRLALVGLLAEVSYRVVEMPIRRERIWVRAWWEGVATATSVLGLAMLVMVTYSTPPVDRFELRSSPVPFVPPTTVVPGAPPRIAVFVDSTARAAADGLVTWSMRTGDAWVLDLSMPGCPMSEYSLFRQSPNEAIRPRGSDCRWKGRFDSWLSDFSPQLVTIIGGTSEVVDFETPDLGWTNILSSDGYDFVRNELTEVVAEARRAAPAARIAMTTAPYNRWLLCRAPCLTHDDRRFDRYNDLVEELALSGVIDEMIDYGEHLDALRLAPNDPRRPDGVHVSEEFSVVDATDWLGPALLGAV
jgi:hypothetical protein